MKPKIAIPEPCSFDKSYSDRALPSYVEAVQEVGGDPVVISLQWSPDEIARRINECSAILLTGSKADVDPQKYSAPRHEKTAPADSLRDTADELLLQELIEYLQKYLIENESEWMEQHFELIHRTSFQLNSLSELQRFCTDLMATSPEKIFKSFDFTSLPGQSLVSLRFTDERD